MSSFRCFFIFMAVGIWPLWLVASTEDIDSPAKRTRINNNGDLGLDGSVSTWEHADEFIALFYPQHANFTENSEWRTSTPPVWQPARRLGPEIVRFEGAEWSPDDREILRFHNKVFGEDGAGSRLIFSGKIPSELLPSVLQFLSQADIMKALTAAVLANDFELLDILLPFFKFSEFDQIEPLIALMDRHHRDNMLNFIIDNYISKKKPLAEQLLLASLRWVKFNDEFFFLVNSSLSLRELTPFKINQETEREIIRNIEAEDVWRFISFLSNNWIVLNDYDYFAIQLLNSHSIESFSLLKEQCADHFQVNLPLLLSLAFRHEMDYAVFIIHNSGLLTKNDIIMTLGLCALNDYDNFASDGGLSEAYRNIIIKPDVPFPEAFPYIEYIDREIVIRKAKKLGETMRRS